jgi:hypothetical protein
MKRTEGKLLGLVSLLLAFGLPLATAEEGMDDLDKKLGIDGTEEKTDGLGVPTGLSGSDEPSLSDKGEYTVELVTWDDPKTPLDSVAVDRSFDGALTVAYWSLDIRLDNLLVTPPDVHFHKDSGQYLTLRPRRKADLKDGVHRFSPGNASFEVKGLEVKSLSASVLVEGETIRLRLVPVTFESTNKDRSRWAPFALKLQAGEADLLKRFEKAGPPLAKRPIWRLTLYLPAGEEYRSSWGTFRVTEDGGVKAGQLKPGVSLQGRQFHLLAPESPPGKPSGGGVVDRWGRRIYIPEPLLWKDGQKVAVYLDPESGARPPTGELQPYALGCKPVSLKFGPAEVPTGVQSAFAQMRSKAVGFEATLQCPWAGPARLRLRYVGGEYDRDAVVLSTSRSVHLFTRLVRTAYLDNEQIECRIVLKDAKAGNADLVLLSEGKPDFVLGSFPVEAKPSQTVFATLDTRLIAAGDYQLVARVGQEQSSALPLAVRPATRQSNLLVCNITICTGGWDTDPQWLAPARQAGIGFEMLTMTGLGPAYPFLHQEDASLAAALRAAGMPRDYARIPADGGLFLDECVRHGVGFIEYPSVYKGWYVEGLSFHHSYPPDVARWIRREQILFGAGADYPSFWGVNYTWFPRLFGYAESGVDTDIHKQDRNRTLNENLVKKGLKLISYQDWVFLQRNEGSKDPEIQTKLKELRKRQVEHVAANADAFYEHFDLYADHIREVRPDGMAFAFENAGHDGAGAGNYLPKFYGALDAATMEAYTDYGDWALEPAFTTDWVRAAMKACPDRQRPFWLAAEWLAPAPIRYGYMLQAVARRVEGTSYPFASGFPTTMDRVVGNIVSFLKSYGGVQPFVEVEPDIAILCSFNQMVASGRANFDYHACYYELTRAQYPPQCIYEETVARGGLRDSGIRALFIVKQTMPLPAKVVEEIQEFRKRGGLVVLDAASILPLDGAHRLTYTSKNIWEGGMGGFEQGHRLALWKQYLQHRDELRALLRERVQPFAQSDDERIITSTLAGGDVRFVFAINDKFDPDRPESQLHVWHRAKEAPVRLRDPKAAVYDLATLRQLEGTVEDGRLLLKLDLFDNPGLILAALPEPIEAVTTNAPAELKAGDELFADARLIGKSGKPINGPTPARFVLSDPRGKQADPLFRAAGVENPAWFRLGLNAEPGEWRLEVTDMVSGRQIVAPIRVSPADKPLPVAHAAKKAIVPRLEATVRFLKDKDPKRIVLEENQRNLKPLAEKLAEAFRQAGGAAQVLEADPTTFGEILLRWYPTDVEQKQYREVEQAKLIGVRQDMESYVDPKTRQHVFSIGGYAGIPPVYILRHPNIVFGGGRLAESLRIAIPYGVSPDDPGPGNAVLALAFSAFEARKHTLAILASDRAGYEVGIEEAIAVLNAPEPPKGGTTNLPGGTTNPPEPPEGGTTNQGRTTNPPLPFHLSPTSPHYTGLESHLTPDGLRITHHASRITRHASRPWREPSAKTVSFEHPIARQFRGFFAGVAAANRNGDFLLRTELGQRRVIVSRDGKVLGSFQAPKDAFRAHLADNAKSVFFGVNSNPHIDWMKPWGESAIVAQCDPNGVLASVSSLWPPAGNTYAESFARQRTSYFVLGPDSQTLCRTREGGLTVGPPGGPYRTFSLSPYFRHFRETHSPNWPMAMALSKDGKTLVFSCWGHPTGANMSQPFPIAMSPQTMAIDTGTLELLWKVVPPFESTWGHAPRDGCLCVNPDGTLAGYVDGRSQLYVIDRQGKTVWHKSLVEKPPHDGAWNVDQVTPEGVRMSDDGEAFLVNYADRGEMLFVRRDQNPLRLGSVPSALAPDGSFVLFQEGLLEGHSSKGAKEWQKELPGKVSVASLGEHGFILVFEDVTVERRDWTGETLWQLPGGEVKAAAEQGQPLRPGPDTKTAADHPVWPVDTLEVLKKQCQAKLLVDGGASKTLKAEATNAAFDVRLAYVKPKGGPPITLALSDGKRKEVFTLDLPAPLGRTQDIAWPGMGRPLTVELNAPEDAQVSEFQLWAFRWPSKNQAYVKPAGAASMGSDVGLGGEEKGAEEAEDEGDLDVEDDMAGRGLYGAAKDARLRVRNPDPDQVSGPFMPPGDNPLKALNGLLYGAEKINDWDTTAGLQNLQGLWLEVDFGKKADFGLLAYYSHTTRQSELVQSIGFMTHEDGKEQGLALAINNDQFFRVFHVPGASCRVLYLYLGEVRHSYGASEIEAYHLRK